MAEKTLSEKLQLHQWERIAYMVAQGERPLVEEARRTVVEAVARWLEGPEAEAEVGAIGDIAAQVIRRELLSAGEGER